MKLSMWCMWLIAASVFSATAVQAQTWLLDPLQGWRDVADLPEGQYLMAVSDIRQQLAGGRRADVVAALKSLQTDYPDRAGGDLDAFIAAEKIYAKGDLGKAGKRYKEFLDIWPDSPLQPAAMERYFSIGAAFVLGQKRIFL